MDEIPTAISKREAQLLRHLPEYNPQVIEVGSLFGYSTLQLADNANKVIAIDPHEHYPEKDAPSTWDKFMHNLRKYSDGNIVPVKKYFQEVDMPKADLAFVDLDGTFNTTIRCLNALKHVDPIIVHDYNVEGLEGVTLAVKQFNRNIRVVDTCAILTKN